MKLKTVKVPIPDKNEAANSYSEVKYSKPYLALVSGMAEWLRHSLAEWKVPGSNLTMGKRFGKVSVKKSFGKKKKKKKKGQLSSACMMEVRMTGVLPNS